MKVICEKDELEFGNVQVKQEVYPDIEVESEMEIFY